MQKQAADVSWKGGMLLSVVAAYTFKAFEKPATSETADTHVPRAVWQLFLTATLCYLPKGFIWCVMNNIKKKFFREVAWTTFTFKPNIPLRTLFIAVF